MVKIPEQVMQTAHLKLNELITCSVENGMIVLTPKRHRYTLEELLEGSTEMESEVDWGKPMGKEVW